MCAGAGEAVLEGHGVVLVLATVRGSQGHRLGGGRARRDVETKESDSGEHHGGGKQGSGEQKEGRCILAGMPMQALQEVLRAEQAHQQGGAAQNDAESSQSAGS